ncbi:Bactericidal permeability-increasing protein [Trichinella pseudospiralis]|uniref:Bactericidal permeability-increasing protein n=1 Tax=Trichinella pseudospiralis TaxID=6337 RepID=A0A0V0YLJ2_TRIPS|nr:Bactericidal permeability-increasing protein [Trichinella pseudospiralis]
MKSAFNAPRPQCLPWLLCFCCCLLLAAWRVDARRRSRLESLAAANNPGIILRITNDGFMYLKDTIESVLRQQLSRVRIAHVQNGTFLRVRFALHDFTIVRVSPAAVANVELRPQLTRQIRLVVDDFDFSFTISVSTSLRNCPVVTFLVHLLHCTFSQSIQLKLSTSKQIQVTADQCSFRFANSDVEVAEYDCKKGLTNIIRNIFAKRLHQLMQENFCQRLASFTEQTLTRVVQDIPVKLPLYKQQPQIRRPAFNRTSAADMKRSNNVNNSHSVTVDDMSALLRDFYVDLGLTKEPAVVNAPPTKYLMIAMKGEIAKQNSAEAAPFRPKRIGNTPGRRGAMMHLIFTDFPINSMLYHMYRAGMLDYKLSSESSPKMANFLRTTCDDLMCVGFGIPELEMRFPNHDVEADFRLHSPPRAAVSYTHLVDDLLGKARFKRFEMKPKRSLGQLQLVKLQNEIIGDVLKSLVEAKLNAILENGFGLPQSKVLKLDKAAMNMEKNALWLTADLSLDEHELQQLAADTIK